MPTAGLPDFQELEDAQYEYWGLDEGRYKDRHIVSDDY